MGDGGGGWETGWRYIRELSQEVRLEVRRLQGGRRHLCACVSQDKRVEHGRSSTMKDDLKAKQDLKSAHLVSLLFCIHETSCCIRGLQKL